jgi:hypothetical protein
VRRLIDLLTLLSVLLLPFGMTAAPAAAMDHDAASMRMPMQHCPDQSAKHDMMGGIAVCTMACAGALPAADLVVAGPPAIVCETPQPAATQQLAGLHPEAATPPPKRS